MEKKFGKVTRLIPSKKSGYIILDNSQDEFYFLASHSSKLDYEKLDDGKRVSFTVGERSKHGNFFANDVEIADEKLRTNTETALIQQNSNGELKTATLIEKLLSAFNDVENCQNPNDFEDAVFILLRCLGIHNLYQYDRKNQSGQADGFFIIGNLAVMYDCSLRDNFEEHKDAQIRNYVNSLNNDSQLTITIKRADGGTSKKTQHISGKMRQVWIITRRNTRELGDYSGIKVKEVSVQDIVKVIATRLNLGIFEEEDLSAKLTLIDRT